MRGFVLFILCLVLLSFNSAYAAVPSDPVIGLWYTEGHEGGVELYACGTMICGRLHWIKNNFENNDVSRDFRNPDPDKRDRALCGMTFMTEFQPDGQGHYTDGTIYSPRHGADFNAEMALQDSDHLELRGYILLPIFGESQVWTRTKIMPQCVVTYLSENE